MPASVVLLVGGDGEELVGPPGALGVAPGALVVAADSGLDLAVALGIAVDHVVGDLDSADPASVAAAEAAGATVHRHLADKDATDSELAVDVIRALVDDGSVARPAGGAPIPLLVVGGGGGRLDHLLADLLLLASPALAGFEVTARLGAATVTIVRSGRRRALVGSPGEQVSVIPAHGRARGVSTDGLRWALVAADLVAGTTRAVSNELVGRSASVAVGEGVVAVIQPGTLAPPIAERPTPYDPTPVDPDP